MNTAQTFYNNVMQQLTTYSLTGLAVMGESSVIDYSHSCSIGGLPPSDLGAQWAVNGYEQSTLRIHGAVFEPFNVLVDSCYANPINIAGSPYNPVQ